MPGPVTVKRRVQEGIHIGNDVFVRVVKCTRQYSTIQITAPSNVKILRDDLYQRELKQLLKE